MKKKKPARLYPEKKDKITLDKDDKQLIILIIIISIILIISCIMCIDIFKAEHFYNYL